MIDVRQVATAWQRSDVAVRDLPLAVLLAVAPWVPALQGQGTQLGDVPHRPVDAWAWVPVVLLSLPLVIRRRWPLVSLVLVGSGFAVDQLTGFHTIAGIGLPIVLLSTGAHLTRHRRAVAVAASVAYAALAVALDRPGQEDATGFVVFYLLCAVAWGLGVWLRQTRAAEAERRRHVAETTRTAERTRIARELHDVVTHHVTAMVVQAEAARYLTGQPERLDRTLDAVSETGRRAIADLRHVLDLLDPGHGAAERLPAIGELREVVEQTRRSGQPVELVEEGDPSEVAGSAEVAAYRVVQEALTNALKHARGSRTTVHVRHGGQEIMVTVSTARTTDADAGVGAAGPGPRPVLLGGSGRGLAGLRERVGVLGGELEAGPRTDGAFVVRARIPVGSGS